MAISAAAQGHSWAPNDPRSASKRPAAASASATAVAGGGAAATVAPPPHLLNLSAEQQLAVTAPLGCVRVMAGPGSGKV